MVRTAFLVVVLELWPQLAPRLVRLPAYQYRGALLLVVTADAVVQPGRLGAVGEPPGDLHWGVLQISLANLIVILLMVAVFVATLFLPFPGRKR
jgi:hypothetical protein